MNHWSLEHFANQHWAFGHWVEETPAPWEFRPEQLDCVVTPFCPEREEP